MEEWKEYKLGEIGTVVGGATPSTKDPMNYDGDISWITPKDLSGYESMYIDRGERMITQQGYNSCSCKMLPKGSVLFSSRAPIGYVAIAANDLCTNQGFKSVIPNNKIVNNFFLYYLLAYNKNFIEGLGSGTTFKEVSGQTMKNIVVKIPSLSKQERIASILKSLDDKIGVNRKINENLEQQAQALFKSWFVDFEPFKNGEFVESELGMIPKGWRVEVLGEFCNIFTGKKDVKQSQPIGLYPFFSCSPNHTYSNEYIYDGPSIIIAGNGSYTGRTSFYFGKFDLYQRTYACTIKEGFNEKIISFLYYMMKCLFEPVKMGGTRGSSIPYIVMNDIVLQKFALDNSLVEKYSDFAYNVMKQIQQNNQESRRLAELRDTLLPKLMSGELKVNEVIRESEEILGNPRRL